MRMSTLAACISDINVWEALEVILSYIDPLWEPNRSSTIYYLNLQIHHCGFMQTKRWKFSFSWTCDIETFAVWFRRAGGKFEVQSPSKSGNFNCNPMHYLIYGFEIVDMPFSKFKVSKKVSVIKSIRWTVYFTSVNSTSDKEMLKLLGGRG